VTNAIKKLIARNLEIYSAIIYDKPRESTSHGHRPYQQCCWCL